MKKLFKRRINGFTLIELLVVVLIIGILAAIALPQYETAVNKSRYAGLMPMAKAVKQAEEEMMMSKADYTDQFADLSVQVPGTINNTGETVTNTDGTTLTLYSDGAHDYVKATKTGLKNNYVMYFDKSTNFPGEIHCEADKNDERAKQICLSYGPINPTDPKTGTTKQYLAYILDGTGNGKSGAAGKEQVGDTSHICIGSWTAYSGPSTTACKHVDYDDDTFAEWYKTGNEYPKIAVYDKDGNPIFYGYGDPTSGDFQLIDKTMGLQTVPVLGIEDQEYSIIMEGNNSGYTSLRERWGDVQAGGSGEFSIYYTPDGNIDYISLSYYKDNSLTGARYWPDGNPMSYYQDNTYDTVAKNKIAQLTNQTLDKSSMWEKYCTYDPSSQYCGN